MRFPFIALTDQKLEADFMPFLPISLHAGRQHTQTYGLLDTGATANVMPFSLGLSLDAVWEEQNIPLRLGGNLANYEARVLFVNTTIEGFPPVELAFAWTKAERVPLLLGQTNFFMEFDVFFCRSGLYFDVTSKI